jgi:hypothetical protein
MKQQDIDQFLLEHPITYDSVRVDFVDISFKVGFFENLVGDFDALRQKNQWRFIENNYSVAYRDNDNDPKHTTIINGDTVDKLTIL